MKNLLNNYLSKKTETVTIPDPVVPIDMLWPPSVVDVETVGLPPLIMVVVVEVPSPLLVIESPQPNSAPTANHLFRK